MGTKEEGRETTQQNEVIVESRELEDAIAEGLARLGVSRDDANIEVLEEGSKGILGIGSRKAKVRVSTGSAAKTTTKRAPKKASKEEPKETPSVLDEGERDAIVEEVVEKIVIALDSDANVEISPDGKDRWSGEIQTDELGIVLGRRGQTIDAIQTLATAIVSRRLNQRVKVILDSAGFREKRQETLAQMAETCAQEAIESGDAIHLDPMSSFDRKTIHSALSENKDVRTESEDRGGRRHVVIRPAGEGSERPQRKRSGKGGGRGRGRGRGSRQGGRGRGRRTEGSREAQSSSDSSSE